jgi:hypothetical protein
MIFGIVQDLNTIKGPRDEERSLCSSSVERIDQLRGILVGSIIESESKDTRCRAFRDDLTRSWASPLERLQGTGDGGRQSAHNESDGDNERRKTHDE